jgi:hypothetical protein
MMSLRIIEPERPGFDSRTFECPKCYGTETFVASISHEIDISQRQPEPAYLQQMPVATPIWTGS